MKRRYLRLLPSVLVVGTGLLFLKGTGLVHEAYAQDAAATAQTDTADAAPAPQPDYAGDDTEVATAAQVDVLTSLSKRRSELDARENGLRMQANVLAATEQRVDGKIAELKKLQSQISALVSQRDDAQKAQIAALVKTYSDMKPAAAAAIFGSMPDNVLVPVAQTMKPDNLGDILAKMRPEEAQKLTVKLANRLTMPDLSEVTAPAPPLTTAPVAGTPVAPNAVPVAAPGPQASAAPAAPAAQGKPPGS